MGPQASADEVNRLDDLLPISRRLFLARSSLGLAALTTLLEGEVGAEDHGDKARGSPHYTPKAKRVIYLFQSGAPSQMDLFDWKPKLKELRGTELPDSIRKGQRLTGMTSRQESFPVAPSMFKFSQQGKSGAWVSELLPRSEER